MTFKEYYLHQEASAGSYFPTFKKVASSIAAAPGAVAKSLRPTTSTTNFPTFSKIKKPIDRAARGVTNWAKSMDPGYKKQFSSGVTPRESSLADAKTTREVNKRFADWRNKSITMKDGTAAEQKAIRDFTRSGAVDVPEQVFLSQDPGGLYNALGPGSEKYFQMSPGTGEPMKLKLGQVLPLMILKDKSDNWVGIVDGKYVKEGTAWPKIFKRPGHYANQFIDSMKRYVDTGYELNQAINMAKKNFNQQGFDILRRNKYLPWESL